MSKKHGMCTTNEYKTWGAMKNRCLSPSSKLYKNYGGRGITICDRWLTFLNFYEDMGDRPEGRSIDRIDNEKGYYPENCRWATRQQQDNNTRATHNIEHKGVIKTLSQWSADAGIKSGTLWTRIYSCGWPMEKALTEPVQKKSTK